MKKRAAIITVTFVSVLVVAAAIFVGLFFGLRTKADFNANIHRLMNGTQLANDEFVGFAIHSARQSGDGTASRVMRSKESAAETVTDTLFAVDEDFTAEEVQFNNLSVENTVEITQKDINEYGAITQIAVMNNILFIQITARDAVTSDEIKEDSYFTISPFSAVFAVDLESKKASSVRDACLDVGLQEAGEIMYFDIRYGLFFTNPGITSWRQETYLIQLQDGIFRIIKVADTPNGEYIQDKYKNIYLFDSEYINHKDYDMNLVTLFTFDDKIYDYFMSSDKCIFRALKSDRYSNGNYFTVESLQADGRWEEETSSSDKILRNQLTYSSAFQGGEWMLKEGNIIRIAYNVGGTLDCYNVDGKLIAHLKGDSEEVVLCIGDENQITADFEYINFDADGYADYEKIVCYETDSPVYRYWISINGTTHILKEYNDDNSFRQYKIEVNDGKIELTEIKPMYNGVEISEEIIFPN